MCPSPLNAQRGLSERSMVLDFIYLIEDYLSKYIQTCLKRKEILTRVVFSYPPP